MSSQRKNTMLNDQLMKNTMLNEQQTEKNTILNYYPQKNTILNEKQMKNTLLHERQLKKHDTKSATDGKKHYTKLTSAENNNTKGETICPISDILSDY